jgi:ABC-type transport system involved in multi-copper enzyme maturation permease subunit
MTAAFRNILTVLSPPSWAGPILDKELRVSSRRRRSYFVRSFYLILLLVFVCFVWARSLLTASDPFLSRVAWTIASHAVAAKAVTVTICVFQFWAVQALAIIMLSTSISDEVTKRTLGTLMTTPITSRQIVMGKLAGGLFQVVLLVSLNLPVLATLRVFGGIPWSYLVASTCITLSTAIFCGCVSLFFSIGARRAYVAIIRTVFVLALLFFFLPTICGLFFRGPLASDSVFRQLALMVLELINPYVIMLRATSAVYDPRVAGSPWLSHCGILLGASALTIVISTIRLRKVALREAAGGSGITVPWRHRWRKDKVAPVDSPTDVSAACHVRSVKGSPVLWRELASPLLKNTTPTKNVIAIVGSILCLLGTYVANSGHRGLRHQFVQTFYVVLFVISWVVVEAVVSATAITAEKESQTWPILLVTPLSDWRIIRDKVVASLLKTSPVWIFFIIHTIVFVGVGYIHPIALLHLPLIAVPVVLLLSCSGLFFSSLLRKSTSAVAANLAFAAAIWVLVPTVWAIYCNINGLHLRSAQILASANPLVMTSVIMAGETGWRTIVPIRQIDYSWPFDSYGRIGGATMFVLVVALVYVAGAAFLLWLTRRRLRRMIFTD